VLVKMAAVECLWHLECLGRAFWWREIGQMKRCASPFRKKARSVDSSTRVKEWILVRRMRARRDKDPKMLVVKG
jgi:hypothetical protein